MILRRVGLVLAGLTIMALATWSLLRHTGFGGTLVILGIAFTGIALTLQPLKSLDKISQYLWLPPFFTFFLTAAIAPLLTRRTGNVEFHSLAAQVIPVLVLAVAIEGRAFSRERVRIPLDFLLSYLTLAGLFIGEFHALRAVVTVDPTKGDFHNVVAALAAGAVGLLTMSLAGGLQRERENF